MLITASLAQPLIWLVLFSQIFRGLADTPAFRRLGYGSYLEFLVPGMVVLSMLFTGCNRVWPPRRTSPRG